MIKVAAALNSFASQEATAPPSEEIFVLSSSQLQDLISQAIEQTTAPLEARIQDLEADREPLKMLLNCPLFVSLQEERGVGCLVGGEAPQDDRKGLDRMSEIVQDLQAENMALKRELEALQELRPWVEALSKKVARLEAPKTSRKTEARAEKIKRYLLERPDHRATFETLKGHLGIGNDLLNKTIKALMVAPPGRYGIMHVPGDKRKRILVMLPK